MTTKKSKDATTADILSESYLDGEIQSSLDFDNLDEVVYNSSSSFDISEIADLLLDNIDQYVFITDATTKNIVYLNKKNQLYTDIFSEHSFGLAFYKQH